MNKILLMVLLLSWPMASLLAQSDMAMVITQGGAPVDCMAAVEINKIDGQQKIVPAKGFEIEPGEHSLNGRALLDTTWCKLNKDDRIDGPVPDLEFNFQAGRTYYIGFDHKPENRQEWQLKVWKVE